MLFPERQTHRSKTLGNGQARPVFTTGSRLFSSFAGQATAMKSVECFQLRILRSQPIVGGNLSIKSHIFSLEFMPENRPVTPKSNRKKKPLIMHLE